MLKIIYNLILFLFFFIGHSYIAHSVRQIVHNAMSSVIDEKKGPEFRFLPVIIDLIFYSFKYLFEILSSSIFFDYNVSLFGA